MMPRNTDAIRLAQHSASGTPRAVPPVAPAAPDGPNARAVGAGMHPAAKAVASEPAVTRLPCPPPHKLEGCAHPDALSPAERYGELFVRVQASGIFADSKTFPDCLPLAPPEEIVARYRRQRDLPGFALERFVADHFARSAVPDSHYVSNPAHSLRQHIDSLWPVLTRDPVDHPPWCSLLPLPYPYVVPGGRFGELYYWDSYFTMLGLAASGRHDLVRAMADNFAYLLDTYGLVPNGTRSYYLSRSQPPVFTLMTELFEAQGVVRLHSYLPHLRAEHAFWMDGADALRPGTAHRRAVRLADGSMLNRYWDDHARPREESFLEDVVTAHQSGRAAHLVFRDLRAAAESGWDFSSRWLDEPAAGTRAPLATIRTTAIVPIDLNALLWHAETRLAALSERAGDAAGAGRYAAMAHARREAIERHMWDPEQGAFVDYDWHRGTRRSCLTAATVMPLFVGLATNGQAARIRDTLHTRLMAEGGLATTCVRSGEQWDQPNGWAPLQWLTIQGLRRHGDEALAREIANRWLATVANLYEHEYKLVEKYRLRRKGRQARGGGGGEYPLQDGFGWTNGVVAMLLREYPDHPAATALSSAAERRG